MRKIYLLFILLTTGVGMLAHGASVLDSDWDDVVDGDADEQSNPSWWSSSEAIRIAENVLLYQREIGGWPKNTDMHLVLSEDEKQSLIDSKSNNSECTIDNGGVYLELTYLSKVYAAISDADMKAKIKEGFDLGIRYLIEAQYDNGGWPQYYPLRGGYSDAITYNDNAMINVMRILKSVHTKDGTFSSITVADSTVENAEEAYNKGIECIVNTQYVRNGKLTVWCAQHDQETLEPTDARSYEHASLSGQESAGILTFLMDIENPSKAVKRAIYAGIKWYEDSKITGISIEEYTNEDGLSDIRVVEDPGADPLWARFYSLENNRPIFSDRDGIIVYALADIGHERRNGYSWYGSAGEQVEFAKSSWLFNWSSTVLVSPYDDLTVTTIDTVNVLAYADEFASENFVHFELTLDTNQTFTYSSEEIDTFFTGLAIGEHSLIIRAVYSNDYSEADSGIFTVTLPSHELNVYDGSGSGTYTYGSQITIEAEAAPEGEIFDRWTGDTAYVGNVFDAVTTLTIPDANVSVRATYKEDPNATDIENESFAKTELLIYPNPVREYLNLDLRGFNSPTIEIYDMQGRKVFSQQKETGLQTMAVTFLDKGEYLIRVTDVDDKPQTIKLLKY